MIKSGDNFPVKSHNGRSNPAAVWRFENPKPFAMKGSEAVWDGFLVFFAG